MQNTIGTYYLSDKTDIVLTTLSTLTRVMIMPRRSLLSRTTKPKFVLVQGISTESYKDELMDKIRKSINDHSVQVVTEIPRVRVSNETMQEDNHNVKEAILSLFVYKPNQTGFAATAAMTQAAILQPESTVIAVIPGDTESADDRVEREEVKAILEGTNATIYDNENEAANYIAQCVEDGIPDPDIGEDIPSMY